MIARKVHKKTDSAETVGVLTEFNDSQTVPFALPGNFPPPVLFNLQT